MIYKSIIEKYSDCKLCKSCKNDRKVFGQGNLKAAIAVIGEGPGREEEEKQIPFVGPAGQLLDKILGAIGLQRDELFLTNTIICRTDNKNRKPTKRECLNCKTRLYNELLVVQPRFTLLVGSIASQNILGSNYSILKEHGHWYTLLDKPCYFYFTIPHPAWILHSATEGEKKYKKRIMWEDIKEFKIGIDNMNKIINWGLIRHEIIGKQREGTLV